MTCSFAKEASISLYTNDPATEVTFLEDQDQNFSSELVKKPQNHEKYNKNENHSGGYPDRCHFILADSVC